MKLGTMTALSFVIASVLVPVALKAAAPELPQQGLAAGGKQRLIVLSDIGGEPDDSESMVRLMVYSNQIDVEGLIATTSVWMKNDTHPDDILASRRSLWQGPPKSFVARTWLSNCR